MWAKWIKSDDKNTQPPLMDAFNVDVSTDILFMKQLINGRWHKSIVFAVKNKGGEIHYYSEDNDSGICGEVKPIDLYWLDETAVVDEDKKEKDIIQMLNNMAFKIHNNPTPVEKIQFDLLMDIRDKIINKEYERERR